MTTGNYEFSGTINAFWVKFKGDKNLWTDWFSREDGYGDGLAVINSTTTWNESLTDVGNVEIAILLHRGWDGIFVKRFAIDNTSYTFTTGYGVWLKNEYGFTDGCDYVRVNFINNTYTEHNLARNCTFGDQLPTSEPTPPSQTPSVAPSMAPSMAPTTTPSQFPSSVPSSSPTTAPSYVCIHIFFVSFFDRLKQLI